MRISHISKVSFALINRFHITTRSKMDDDLQEGKAEAEGSMQ